MAIAVGEFTRQQIKMLIASRAAVSRHPIHQKLFDLKFIPFILVKLSFSFIFVHFCFNNIPFILVNFSSFIY